MRSRREFFSVLGGAAAMPFAARAQERMRHIGVLSALAADNPENQARAAAFLQGLQQLGWTVGRNVRIDTAWAPAMPIAFAGTRRNWPRSPGRHPGPGTATMGRAAGDPHRADRVCACHDPVGAGLRREPGAAGRQRHRVHPVRIQPQREMAGTAQADRAGRDASGGPSRSAYPRNRPVRRHPGRGAVVGVEVSPLDVRDAGEIERAIAAFAASPNGGLIVTASAPALRIAN